MINFFNWLFPDNLRLRTSVQLQNLVEDDKVSSRKKVLFVCACYRRVWDKVDLETRKTVEKIEKIKFQSRPGPIKTQNIIDDAFCNFYITKMTRVFNDTIISINHDREILMDVVPVAIHTARLSTDSRKESIWQLKLWNHLVRS
jgi:hypothetical protein